MNAPAVALHVVDVACASCALGLGAWEAWRARRAIRAEGAWVVALLAFAVALRVAAPAGPQDINSRSMAALLPATSATWLPWGLGMGAWGSVVTTLVPLRPVDEAVLFHVAPVVDGLSCLLMVAWLRALDVPRLGAWCAGLALALVTPLVQFAHTDVPAVPEILFTLLGLLFAARHVRAPSVLRGLGVGAALGLAAQMRAEAVFVPVLVAPLAFASPRPFPWRHRGTWAGIGLLGALLAAHAAGMAAFLASAPPYFRGGPEVTLAAHPLLVYGPRHLLFLDPAWVSRGAALLAALGLVLGPGTRVLRLGLALAAVGLAAIVWMPDYTPIGGVQLMMARYQLRALPPFAALVGLGGAALATLVGGRPGRALAVATVILGVGVTLPTSFTPRTPLLEYRFFREGLSTLPSPCTLSSVVLGYDAALEIASYGHLPVMLGKEIRLQDLDAPDPPGCHVYYRSTACVAHVVSEAPDAPEDFCAAWEARHALTPIVEGTLPARGFARETYALDPVPVGFYRVEGPRSP